MKAFVKKHRNAALSLREIVKEQTDAAKASLLTAVNFNSLGTEEFRLAGGSGGHLGPFSWQNYSQRQVSLLWLLSCWSTETQCLSWTAHSSVTSLFL